MSIFLDKIGSFFDQRFIVAFWTPAFISFGLASGLVVIFYGPVVTLGWLAKLNGTELVLLGVGVLLVIILLAYLLEALSDPLIRLYEGSWPEGRLNKSLRALQQKALNRLLQTDKQKSLNERHAYFIRYYKFPIQSELLKPTRLGNILAAAEEYSYQLYQLDTYIWWPRLTALLPGTFRARVDTSFAPMLTLLNLCTMLTIISVLGGATELLTNRQWWLFFAIFIVGLLLARACYFAAVNQAVDYGKLLRVAFDLYRHEILKQMHIPVPDNLIDERVLWTSLNSWVYYYIPPWEVIQDIDASKLTSPFYYDTHTPSTPPTLHQEIAITIKNASAIDSSTLNVKNEEADSKDK